MIRKLGCLVIALGLALPVWAGEQPGTISGFVRNASGVPQMGAMVEVLRYALPTMRAFTDARGFYSIRDLVPGTYNLKVSAPYFLPATRPQVGLRGGTSVVVNVTLSTLFEGVQSATWKGSDDNDDWKWVLRSASNRPILRALSGDDSVLEKTSNRDFKGTLSFLAGSGSQGFGGGSDMSTGFSVEKSIFASGVLAVRGNVGYGEGMPGGVVRASYTHKMANGSTPKVALTMRNLPSPVIGLRNSSLQALALTTSDEFVLGDVLELKFGSELQTIQFMGRVTAFRPFGSVGAHLSPNTLVEYSYASSEPDTRRDKGFDTAPADLSEAQPRMSVSGFAPALERAHHHEVSLSHRYSKDAVQIAVYSDRITNPALTGVGELSSYTGDFLADPYSGTFTYQGHDLDTTGVRVVLQHKFTPDISATFDYGYGGVLDFARGENNLQDVRESTEVENRHTLGAKIDATMSRTKTRWVASYRWTSGQALTPVDMFDASPGQMDPYLGFFLRQPIPGTNFLTGHMDAVIDIRNLLAQGYVPMVGNDGRTVYLVQAARSVRGGVAFTF